jgi:isochorismate synthase
MARSLADWRPGATLEGVYLIEAPRGMGKTVLLQVLARRIQATATAPIDLTRVLRALRDRFAGATIFALRRGGTTFLGASPEELVGLRGDRVAASALAGSSRGAGDGRWLLDDCKERREHAFVVEALRDRLAPICTSLHVPDAPELMTLPDLSHLSTPVRGRLAEPRGLLELAGLLHPTPAVGATPRESDRSAALEPFDRGWYAGPVGWARGDRGGEGDAVVALRSALLRGRRAALYAGCGIVQGSDPELEWREARLKMAAVRDALSVAVGGDGPAH